MLHNSKKNVKDTMRHIYSTMLWHLGITLHTMLLVHLTLYNGAASNHILAGP